MKYVICYARRLCYPGYVQIAVLNRTKQPHMGSINLPGGKVEDGETFEEAGAREFEEETGLKPFQPVKNRGNLYVTAGWDGTIRIGIIDCGICNAHYKNQHIIGDEDCFWEEKETLLKRSDLVYNLKMLIPLLEGGETNIHVEDDGKGTVSVNLGEW